MQAPTTITTTGETKAAADACVASAGIVGGSGYTGALLAELLLKHPSVKLGAISSETLAGEQVQRHLPRLRTGLLFCSQTDLTGVDVAFLCTPHGDTAPIARKLLDDGVKVVDLSADFRLDAATYAEWYGEHPHPELLPGVYGLTELHREEVAQADLVANPGCYPTAALLALAPLKQIGLVDVIIDAKSGVSGAGKTPKPATHFCSVDSDLVAYGVASHRHFPEIAAGLAAVTDTPGYGSMPSAPGTAPAGGGAPSLTFIPHLVPLQRGISETIYVKPGTWPLPSQGDLLALYEEFYAGETFVEVCDAPPQLKDVVGTNYCRIFPYADARAGRIVVISVIDNLMKGASGQAVQNMNVMLGLPEHEGLV
ncbi:MAG: N-acetyl-gamma-glutamyl-phosphate reductase [Actinobacteria bacterium]|nr:N-acetyl-gamma-glutamyl-phosphate reductase [Actinomycetota bacterium]